MKLADKIVMEIEAYNNTTTWRNGNSLFVDSMKYPRCFINMVMKKFNIEGVVLYEERNNKMILMGEESTGLIFGGRETHCNVCRFDLKESDFSPQKKEEKSTTTYINQNLTPPHVRKWHTEEGVINEGDTVYLYFPNGKIIKENNYKGDNCFGGYNVYALIANWNEAEMAGNDEEFDTLLGITILGQDDYKIKFPVKLSFSEYKKYADLNEAVLK